MGGVSHDKSQMTDEIYCNNAHPTLRLKRDRPSATTLQRPRRMHDKRTTFSRYTTLRLCFFGLTLGLVTRKQEPGADYALSLFHSARPPFLLTRHIHAKEDSWAHRLGVLSAAAGVTTRETIGDTLPAVAAASCSTSPLPVVECDGNSVRVGGPSRGRGKGRSRVHHTSARPMSTAAVAMEAAARGRKDCCESALVRLGGELSRQLEAVAAGERRVNDLTWQHRSGGGGEGGSILANLREEALSLRAEENALLEELALRQATVDLLAEELRGVESSCEEVRVSLDYNYVDVE